MALPLSRRRERLLELGEIAGLTDWLSPCDITEDDRAIRLGAGGGKENGGERKGGGERKSGAERKSGEQSQSPTGGPSQTSDRKPLDRDPTEEGSAGKDRSR